MPVARLDVPIMARENGVAGSGGEIEDLEGGVVGGGQEFGVARCPGQVPDGIVVCIVDCFDVVEVWSPVFHVASLSTRN